ncbi:hypothetical protein RRG08_027696 [Elysia crispata]|uniref:Uncharacterized protein n=1 Tax=Elysia crispata TaxID=231223 RepID=A0AAE1CIV3_9GAST|nr:hypothetical protein RRG08_027696 [Elysia crispata]
MIGRDTSRDKHNNNILARPRQISREGARTGPGSTSPREPLGERIAHQEKATSDDPIQVPSKPWASEAGSLVQRPWGSRRPRSKYLAATSGEWTRRLTRVIDSPPATGQQCGPRRPNQATVFCDKSEHHQPRLIIRYYGCVQYARPISVKTPRPGNAKRADSNNRTGMGRASVVNGEEV